MAEPSADCTRCRRLLARLDEASARGADDPTAALDGDDVAWLAQHLESCAVCTPEPAMVAGLGSLLRDAASLPPDEAFFAARRTALLDAIRASDTTADGGVVGAGTPARVATRPVLRAIPGTGTRAAARRSDPEGRRSLWRPVLPALAAGLVIAVALGALRARSPRPDAAEVAVVEVASVDLMAAIEADSVDDSWVVASTDPFDLALSSTADPALDELSDGDLDDFADDVADIEEVEGVFVPGPGWS